MIRGFSEAFDFFLGAFCALLAGVAVALETRAGLAFLEMVLVFLDAALALVETALVFLDTALAFEAVVLVFLAAALTFVDGALAFFFVFVVDFAEAADVPRFEEVALARAGRFAAVFLGVFRLAVLDLLTAAFALISSPVNARLTFGDVRVPILDGHGGSAATAAEPAHLTKKAR